MTILPLSAGTLFTVLSVTYGISTFGNFLNLLAMNLYVLHLTGDPIVTGLMMAVRLTAAFSAGPIAGRVAARFSRRAVLACCDGVQATAMLALFLAPAASHRHLLWVTALVLGAGNTFFMVALRTSVPDLTGPTRLTRGNGSLVTARALGTVLGFAAAGPLIGTLGYGAAFAVNGASFLVSAAVLGWLPLSFGGRDDGSATPSPARPRTGHGQGSRSLLVWPAAVVAVLALRGAEGWAGASHNVALPLFAAAREPDAPVVLLSQFWTAWAVGSLSMNWLVGRATKWRGPLLGERAYACATALASAAFITAFLDVPVAAMVLVVVVAGFADGLAELSYSTFLQDRPAGERARLFGTSAAVETLGLAGGTICCAFLLERSAPLTVVALFHGVAIVAAAVHVLLRSPRVHSRRRGQHMGARR